MISTKSNVYSFPFQIRYPSRKSKCLVGRSLRGKKVPPNLWRILIRRWRIEIFHVSTLSKRVELLGTSELSEPFEYKIPDSSCMQNRKTNRVKMELGVCRAIILGSYWFLLCSEACWNNPSCREYTPLAGNRRKTILDRNIIKQVS